MNYLAAIISLFCIGYFAIPFWFLTPTDEASKDSHFELVELKGLYLPPKELDELEHDWLKLEFDYLQLKANQAEKQNDSSKQLINTNGQLLNIGDNSYHLLGIFKVDEREFILISTALGEIKKVSEGQNIDREVKLVSIKQASISLATALQTKEFKLFQRQNDEKTK